MTESMSKNIQLWDRAPAPLLESSCDLEALSSPDASSSRDEVAHQLFAAESMCWYPKATQETSAPWSLQWYLDAEHLRYTRYARWIPSVMEFERHKSERVLCLGEGLGTDWVQFAREGAYVTAGCTDRKRLDFVRTNFELREMRATFLIYDTRWLPLESASIDVVCLAHLPHDPDDAETLLDEVFRVLKPGGKVLAVVHARYDIDFYSRLLVPWHYWWGRWRNGGYKPESQHSRRSLRKVFSAFGEHRIHKRHLRRSDVPHPWRFLSTSTLQRIVGRRLILKAFKPLSSARSVLAAA